MQPLKISLSGTSQIPALHLCWSRHQYRHAKSGRMHSPVTAMPSAFERPSNRRKRCSGRMIRSRSTRPSAAKVAAKGRGGGASADDDGGVGDAISSHDERTSSAARAHQTIEGGFAKLPLLPGAMLGMAAEYQSTLLADTLYCLVGNMIAWVAFYAATYPLTAADRRRRRMRSRRRRAAARRGGLGLLDAVLPAADGARAPRHLRALGDGHAPRPLARAAAVDAMVPAAVCDADGDARAPRRRLLRRRPPRSAATHAHSHRLFPPRRCPCSG